MDKKKSWFFYSNAKRIGFLDTTGDLPGPGQYEYSSAYVKEKQYQDAFGSTTERNVLFSHDPHRPFGARQSAGPPVGYYFSKEQLNRIDELKHKYVTPKIIPSKPGFGSTEDRFNILYRNKNAELPGPGAYIGAKTKDQENITRGLLDLSLIHI